LQTKRGRFYMRREGLRGFNKRGGGEQESRKTKGLGTTERVGGGGPRERNIE